MNNDSTAIVTWKQIPVVISILTLLILIFSGYVVTKADKSEVERVEIRCLDRIESLEYSLREMTKEIRGKQDKTYEILLRLHRDGYISNPPTRD